MHGGAGLLGGLDSETAATIVESDVLSTMLELMHSSRRSSQLCGLRTLASLALVSDRVAEQLMTPALLKQLQVGPSSFKCPKMP